MANRTKDLLLILFSTAAALIVSALALFFLAAGGHGWDSTGLSATTLLLGPAGVAAWCFAARASWRGLAFIVIACNVAVDVAFAIFTLREGLEYVHATWSHRPLLVVVWAVGWCGLQAVPVLAISGARRTGPDRVSAV